MPKIEFRIGRTAGIELTPLRPIQRIDLDEIFSAELFCEGMKFTILNDGNYSSGALQWFDLLLANAIAEELELHESIREDVGLVWNKHLWAVTKKLDRAGLAYDLTAEGHRRWVGLKYYLWSNSPANLAFWLYAKMGKFFIELTPEYPWALCEPEPDEVIVPYDEFMKNYKPILILEIPREALVRWKCQTGRLMRVVESNEKRIRANFFASRRTRRLRRLARLKRAVR